MISKRMYDVSWETDARPFGEHWCGPMELPRAEDVLIAQYEGEGDGQAVDVYVMAMPARFYTLRVQAGVNSIGEAQDAYEMTTGSGQTKLVALMAEAIAKGMLGFGPEQLVAGEGE